MTEQYPTPVRYAGSSRADALAGIVGGRFAPLIFASLFRAYHNGHLAFRGDESTGAPVVIWINLNSKAEGELLRCLTFTGTFSKPRECAR